VTVSIFDALARRDDTQAALDARLAAQERRADRARQLMCAAEVILLGHDDDEHLTLSGDLAAYSALPGVRQAATQTARPPQT
jgi:ABC-type Fe3+/spermidine/putrescine transport system ATPase subunit